MQKNRTSLHAKSVPTFFFRLLGSIFFLLVSLSALLTACADNNGKQDAIIKTEVLEDSATAKTAITDSSVVLKDTQPVGDTAVKARILDENKMNRLKGKLNLNVEEVKKKMELKKTIKDNRE